MDGPDDLALFVGEFLRCADLVAVVVVDGKVFGWAGLCSCFIFYSCWRLLYQRQGLILLGITDCRCLEPLCQLLGVQAGAR